MKKPLNHCLYRHLTLLLLSVLITACAPAGGNTATSGAASSNGQTSSTVSNTTTVSGATTISGATVSDTAASTSGSVTEIHIGYQRGGEYWNLLKAQGTLEKRFGPNVKVTWSLFSAGPPLLEALNAGAVDIGSVGETPPIFAQAAGAPLLYVAQQAGSGAGSAILVPADSPLKKPEDLKGKKIAFTKASSAHLLTIRALEKYGLKYSDITPALLAPPDARAAFQGGSVDAWTIWNPFLESAKQELNARVLIDGADVGPTKGYIIASRPFVEKQTDKVLTIIEELQKAQDWSATHLDEYASLLEKETQVPAAVWKGAFDRELPKLLFLDEQTADAQQKVADIFYALKLIPDKIDVKSVIWYGDKLGKK